MTNRNHQKARMCHLVVLVVVLVTPAPARALLPGINYPAQPPRSHRGHPFLRGGHDPLE
jgi:hypothetical protein